MVQPKISIRVLGQMPPGFDIRELPKWKSRVFAIEQSIETYQLNEDGAGDDWEYTDHQLDSHIKKDPSCSFQIIFVGVKLEQNWYARRLPDNRILFTFYELDQILRLHRLPFSNLALRVIYAATLIYKRYGDRIPPTTEHTDHAHDETRGCLFDMNASKIDIIHSLHQPKVCEFCTSQLKQAHLSNELLDLVQKELRRIRKPLIDRLTDFIREHTVVSIVISILSAIVVGTITSVLANFLYDALRSAN